MASLDAEEAKALQELEAEYEKKRTELRKSFEEKRKSLGSSAVGGMKGLGPRWTRGEIEAPAASRSMGSYTVRVYTEEQQAPSFEKKMTLWEREQAEAHGLEEERAARIAALDSVRAREAEAARLREEEWRKQDEERFAQEDARRKQLLEEQEKAQRAAEERGNREKAELEASLVEEQKRLKAEQDRQAEIFRKKHEAEAVVRSNADEYRYTFEEGMEKKIQTFRQRGQRRRRVQKLEDTEPRYLLFIHTVKHSDGRTQFPIAFICFLPETMPTHVKVMYTRAVNDLAENTFKVPKYVMLEELEDLTATWLEKKLEIVRK
ncbi:glia maturation factor beta [Chrysochromulina tobinii]|uniref:Glia maturation factor beta n=1 Tax=Chrysochromulina tobinii TaxID=1460289 RepID=A0A0M0JI51_9EUKA|nr:glia maturation factor beta [Chrysochromulina tobinii]|eukprot:KOO26155.1 glia maturation factor beta [Chrysochromulina sp. CCMP291]